MCDSVAVSLTIESALASACLGMFVNKNLFISFMMDYYKLVSMEKL
jgi:hypothetical protein